MTIRIPVSIFTRQLLLPAVIFIVGIALMFLAWCPLPTNKQISVISPVVYQTAIELGINPSVLDHRLITLEWPTKLRLQGKSEINLSVIFDKIDQGSDHDGSLDDWNFGKYNLVAVSRLEMAGIQAFNGERREPLLPEQDVHFHWDLSSEKVGKSTGKVWLYLELVPKDGGETETILILARPIEMETFSVFGMNAIIIRITGMIGVFVGAWLIVLKNKRNRKDTL